MSSSPTSDNISPQIYIRIHSLKGVPRESFLRLPRSAKVLLSCDIEGVVKEIAPLPISSFTASSQEVKPNPYEIICMNFTVNHPARSRGQPLKVLCGGKCLIHRFSRSKLCTQSWKLSWVWLKKALSSVSWDTLWLISGKLNSGPNTYYEIIHIMRSIWCGSRKQLILFVSVLVLVAGPRDLTSYRDLAHDSQMSSFKIFGLAGAEVQLTGESTRLVVNL
jgi:hypothetical protein